MPKLFIVTIRDKVTNRCVQSSELYASNEAKAMAFTIAAYNDRFSQKDFTYTVKKG